MQDRQVKKKLPFTIQDYHKMLDTKLSNKPQPVSLVERVRQAASKIRGGAKG